MSLRSDLERVHAELGRILSKVPHEVPAPRSTTDPDPSTSRPFIGAPMAAKFAGRCSVCGNAIEIGASIVYQSDNKKAAHLGCGQPRGHR